MSEVANTSQKIAANVEEIAISMDEINKASHNTASKGVETTQAADELVLVSGKLEELAKRFRV
jgi:methyl-accepting chemotaxis protein